MVASLPARSPHFHHLHLHLLDICIGKMQENDESPSIWDYLTLDEIYHWL